MEMLKNIFFGILVTVSASALYDYIKSMKPKPQPIKNEDFVEVSRFL